MRLSQLRETRRWHQVKTDGKSLAKEAYTAMRDDLIKNGIVTPEAKPAGKTFVVDVLNCKEGRVAVQTPCHLSKESVDGVRAFFSLILDQLERCAAE